MSHPEIKGGGGVLSNRLAQFQGVTPTPALSVTNLGRSSPSQPSSALGPAQLTLRNHTESCNGVSAGSESGNRHLSSIDIRPATTHHVELEDRRRRSSDRDVTTDGLSGPQTTNGRTVVHSSSSEAQAFKAGSTSSSPSLVAHLLTEPSDVPAGTRPNLGDMPRTSSIDSAISSISAASSQRPQQDGRDPSPSSIQTLIKAAGSAENLILHLLKEKNQAATQNNQLWKLVGKQRALLMGLNKDLERVTREKEKYRRRLKEEHARGGPPRAATRSPHGDNDRTITAPAVKTPDQFGLPPVSIDLSDLESTKAKSTYDEFDAPGPAVVTPGRLIKAPGLDTQGTGISRPALSLTEASPILEKSSKSLATSRKVPAPLNLVSSNSLPNSPTLISPGDKTRPTTLEDRDEQEHRGRRATREDDDRDREKSLKEELDAQSRSKKDSSKSAEVQNHKAVDASAPALAPTNTVPPSASPRPPNTLKNSNTLQPMSITQRLIPAALRSPGLPSSPRPLNGFAAFTSLPMSPRTASMPLSPRAPKQAVPAPVDALPFTDPATVQRQYNSSHGDTQYSDGSSPVTDPYSPSDIPLVSQDLVSTNYPNLLLPPNAIPSVQIKVASSRLKNTRHSMLGLKSHEDLTTFSISIFSRATRAELWRIEKTPAAMPQLEQQLRPKCASLPKVPERRLLTGQSPAAIEARRKALETYFEELLEIELDETSALIICRFLSTDVLSPPEVAVITPGTREDQPPHTTTPLGRVVKTGFLTKKGKNFGGWKSRYFILDSPELRYFESPGGAHLGTIKLINARIGSQKNEDVGGGELDDQYRHAFLIQEPKKKDSTTYVRHVLCAESDIDRDLWVQALVRYTGSATSASAPATQPGPATTVTEQETDGFGRGTRPPVDARERGTSTGSPSPTSINSLTDTGDQTVRGAISGPMNGAPIQDSTRWGNIPATPQLRDNKGGVMGKLFYSKKTSSAENLNSTHKQDQSSRPRVLRHNGYVRAVFGLPLADAVEYCAPFNLNVQLPAVVYRSIEYLRFRNALNEEGLFRLSGSNITVKTLKERFNNEGDVDLVDAEEYYDVHAVASLFKTYLRELPSPLLTRDLHIEFMKVLELESQVDKISAFNVLVHRLPKANFELVRAMSEYLLEVTENAAKNKMTIRNMGIVFSPTVNIPTPVFNSFLSEFNTIFGQAPGQQDTPASASPRVAGVVPDTLTPDDVRSPRHQMFSDLPTPVYTQTQFTPPSGTGESKTRGPHESPPDQMGFAPLQPAYEQGNYVSHPQEGRSMQAITPPKEKVVEDVESEETYGSLNKLIIPSDGRSAKARNRESAMFK